MQKLIFFNFIKCFCADFDQKLGEVNLVHHYDLFLPNCGCHDFTADSSKKKQVTVCFFFLFLTLA